MGRGKSRFRQSDLTRAMKAAKAAGLELARIEIDIDGTIKIIPGSPEPEPIKNEWDEVFETAPTKPQKRN